MTDLYQQPLKGTALYNPHLHGKQELISLFAVRQDLLDLLLEDLRLSSERAPQHHLIIGQRGMGKTMLLRRIAYAIEDDPSLKDVWLPLSFPEEQYNIARLSDFWLNCTDALSDLLDARGERETAEELDEKAESLRYCKEERRAREALALLVEVANRLERRLVLLVDNVDLVFERIKDQEWLFREVLSSEPALLLIGASANAIESTFTYDQAFYDFFRIHELEGLSLEETKRLLVHYAEIWQQPEVKRLTGQEPARIKVLHNLTGGNPRTIVLLFNVLATGAEGDVRTDLEKLLDQCTPLYKARFEALSPQAQQVVHAMAVHWDPVSAGQLAELLGMEVNAVSSQLTRLVKQGVVEKMTYDPESKTGFQIAERFFNIWYLMRASRRLRRRLLWLVEFLKIFYSQEQLRGKAQSHIEYSLSLGSDQRLRYAEYSFALAEAISDRTWRRSLESSGLYALLRDAALHGQLSELIDLEDSEPSFKKRAEQQQRFESTRLKVVVSGLAIKNWSGEDFWVKLNDSLLIPLEFKVAIAEALDVLPQGVVEKLKLLLDSEQEQLESKYNCRKAIQELAKAVRTGLMTGPTDVEGASHAESVLGSPGLRAIALANVLELSFDGTLMYALERELPNTISLAPCLTWLKLSFGLKPRPGRARITAAIAKIKGLISDEQNTINKVDALVKLGRVLTYPLKCCREAEEIIQEVLRIDSRNGDAWGGLTLVLLLASRYEDAEYAGRQAVEADPDVSDHWLSLGLALSCLNRNEEAEQAYRKATEINPGDEIALVSLGIALEDLGHDEAAESAYLNAIQISPGVFFKNKLARLRLRRGNYRSARDLVEGQAPDREAKGILAAILVHEGDWHTAAEYAREFIASMMDSEFEENWPPALTFFREAVRAGKAREAAAFLDELGASERWRPLREALEVITRGSDSYLRRVAPEVRQPAREILKQLREETPTGASPAETSSPAALITAPPPSPGPSEDPSPARTAGSPRRGTPASRRRR